MGRIKSALEIALERSEGIPGDKGSIASYEAKQRGKKAANEFLSGGAPLDEFIKKTPKEEQQSVKDGAFETLLAQASLPALPEDLKRLELVGRALSAVVPDRRIGMLWQQFMGAASQYLEESAQFEEAVKRQYAPKLRQKEEELARRLGREVKIDPFQDPEFVAFYNQNMSALKANYEGMVGEVRAQAAAIRAG